ncbi:MAG: hypothetical protein WCC12_04365 [Anaerolineales bacterium]
MPRIHHRFFSASLTAILVLSSLFSACTPTQATPTEITPSPAPTPNPTGTPTATPVPLPEITLKPGDMYFSVDGRQSFIFSRNLAGYETWQYDELLGLIQDSGSILVRIQLDSLGTGITSDGKVDEAWARKWEHVFARAQDSGINVLPVFSGWFDWNNGNPDYGYSTWEDNAFNAAKGGPAADPGELFQADSATQKMWFDWMKTLVERWHDQENIAAWEIFSEVNIATDSTEASGVSFIEQAAAIIRNADPRARPITASLADVGEWPRFYQSSAIDFLNIHPYPYRADIDLGTKVISDVRKLQAAYGKPIIIGESGLNAFLPDSKSGSGVLPNAQLGLKHAIWSELVSGAMNGRSLYWEDSFAIFFPTLSWDYLKKSTELERPVVAFTQDVDFAGFAPLPVMFPAGTKVWGAAVGNEKAVIGWFRDANCEPPNWPVQPVISGQTVTITVPGSASEWKIDFYDTKTGTDIISSTITTRQGDNVIILLPDFTDDIAFKMYPRD